MAYIFINDKTVPDSEAMISVYDHGFLYGDGIYETMRSYDGVVFMREQHLERLSRSAAFIRLKAPSEKFVEEAVRQTLAANGLADAYIRITVSRGKGPIGLDPDLCPEPTFVVFAQEFRRYPESWYRDGVRLILAGTRRNPVDAVNPRIKSLNFLNNILAKIEAKDRGAQEAVMLNEGGYIAEGTISNIFFMKDELLRTPSLEAGILDGITRDLVISLARRNGVKVEEGLFLPQDLLEATEVFYTNTTSEIMPVSMVDQRPFIVGEATRFLHRLYREEVVKYVEASRR
ncbi:MAG: aminotransferase class IV [Nitrospiraceae bacterium]|nr:aminotransferase class IV [Nitrospiraceae bacterium]